MGRITNDLFDVTEFAHHCPEEFFIAELSATARKGAYASSIEKNIGISFFGFISLPP